MPRVSPVAAIEKYLSRLLEQRKKHIRMITKHQQALDTIEQTFARLGIKIEEEGRRLRRTAGRPRTGQRRRRKKFRMTGEESVLAFVKKHGRPTAKEVNEHWKKEGRGGKADNTLSKLVKEGKLKRIPAEDARGSRYVLA